MIVVVLLAALWLIGAAFAVDLLRLARVRGQLRVHWESAGLGAVTDFFDTLGIGSFAPTTAWIKLRKLVPDGFIPATLNVGHCLPSVAEALIFITLVRVDPLLLVSCIVSAVAGALVGGALASRPYYPPPYYYGPYPYYGPRCGRVWNGYAWVPAC